MLGFLQERDRPDCKDALLTLQCAKPLLKDELFLGQVPVYFFECEACQCTICQI